MKMTEKQENECAHSGGRKLGYHKFTVVETKMAVPRYSRIDESSLGPYDDQVGMQVQRKRIKQQIENIGNMVIITTSN